MQGPSTHFEKVTAAPKRDSKYAGQSLSQVQALMTSKIQKVVKSLLEEDTDVDLQAPLMELGLDSLATMQLVRQLGEELRVQLAPTLLFDHPTVAALSAHVASLVSPEAKTEGPFKV